MCWSRRYEDIAEGSDFARLVDTMSAGRDDSRLMQIVLDIRGRVQAHPNPAAWLDGQERAFALEGVDDPGETPWGRLLLDDAGRQGAYWRDKIAQALELCPCDANLDANYAPSLSATLAALDAFVEGTRRGWDAARAALPIPFPTAGRKKMVDCPDAAEQVKAIRSTCKKRMEKLGEWFEDCGADLLEDLRAVHPAVRGLFALVKDFEGAYAAEKARRGMVDFADLEHMAVRLLVGEDGAPTELARQWSARYDEIMVDEYQDTNEVQNAIFTALSRNGTNLFLVGDVKQSIYRFRLADPTIFLGKYRAFADYTRAAEGEERRLILSRNFRSRPEVLEGANFVFRNVMSADFGEMDYTADEALYPGAPFPPDGRYAVELDAVDASAEGEEEKTARDLHRGPLCGQAHPGAGGRGLSRLRRRGRRAARPPGRHRDFTPLPQHGAPPLRPRPGGAGHPLGGGGRRRLLRRHRGERGPLPAPDRGQPKAGRAPHLRPPLPGVRLLRRPAGGAPGRQSRHRLLRRPGRRRGGGQPGLSGRAGRAALRRGGVEQPRAALAALRPHQSAGGVRRNGQGGRSGSPICSPWRSWPAASRARATRACSAFCPT